MVIITEHNCERSPKNTVNQVKLLNRITSKIRQSLELQTILDTAVTEVRAFLQTDRVKIYKFDEDGNGQVIAESIEGDRLPSLKGLNFPAGDIPPQTRELFLKAKVRSIINLAQQQMSLSEPNRLPSTATGELTLEEVREEPLKNLLQRPVDPCHVEYLTLMGIQSSMVIPLVNESKLWGLLIAHNRRAKVVSHSSLQIIQVVAEQLEMAIAQANLFHTVQQKAQQETLINQISNLLHSPLENQQILPEVLARIVTAIDGTGGLLCLNNPEQTKVSCYQYGLAKLSSIDWSQLQNLASTSNDAIAIDDIESQKSIESLLPALRENKLRSLLLVPLHYKQENMGNLAIFRQEIDVETLWAGNFSVDERQLRPRQSFDEWKELKQGQAQPWKANEQELIQSLSDNLSLAIIQNRLYHQEKKQRVLLEMRNQELDHAREEAQKGSQLKSMFLSTSSHELRTPLAQTLNYLKLLKEGFYDNEEELAEYIATAHLSTENLRNIVDNLLDIAKIEAGKMDVELVLVDLESLFTELDNLFKPDTIERDIKLLIECEVTSIYADPLKLKQVLTNLLNNAFKFTRQGTIQLRAAVDLENKINISVSDTGIGIEPEQQGTIFDPFVQEDGSTRRHYGGTGLGLTICKDLVELMGGEIDLTSEGRDRGTQITITLPIVG